MTKCCREQLELLEDKLRDFRCLRDNQYDDKVLSPPWLCCVSCCSRSTHSFSPNTAARNGVTAMLSVQTVALSQLDSLRRELIACARDRLEFLVFTKVSEDLL